MKGIKKIEIIKCELDNLYDIHVDGEVALVMLSEDELPQSIAWLMSEGIECLKEGVFANA